MNESQSEFEKEIANLLVQVLNLEIKPEAISPIDALYGDGLGIDSIDVLEIALAISKQYGITIKSDNPNNKHIFSSLRALSEYIQTNRLQ